MSRCTAGHVCRCHGRVVASGRRGSPCRARGRSPASRNRCRATSDDSPAEPNVTIAPAPPAARSPSRPPDRRADQAAPERAVPGPARRHEAVPERQGRAAGRGPGHPRGRLRVPRRSVGRRQVHAHQAAHPRRGRDAWGCRPGRPGSRSAAAPQGPQDAPQDRDHLPGLQAPAVQDGLGERRVRPRGDRHAAPQGQARRGSGPGARRPHGPGQPDPEPAVRWRAAAHGDRPRARPRPAPDHRRRTRRATSTRSSAGRSCSSSSASTSSGSPS